MAIQFINTLEDVLNRLDDMYYSPDVNFVLSIPAAVIDKPAIRPLMECYVDAVNGMLNTFYKRALPNERTSYDDVYVVATCSPTKGVRIMVSFDEYFTNSKLIDMDEIIKSVLISSWFVASCTIDIPDYVTLEPNRQSYLDALHVDDAMVYTNIP